ncbi:hypothetical protein L2Z53_11940 (plasmid) [Macrococcoides canis]|uniref:hypothetical protein n=1 Tax=Macrococcoides canis TaxID=1855823 RepID=UPI001F301AAF|nr:hypothetical protein [Macrococcus canis]UJS29046.1 hypothetical protein L2Z53_11940 [Macrococcus canis]
MSEIMKKIPIEERFKEIKRLKKTTDLIPLSLARWHNVEILFVGSKFRKDLTKTVQQIKGSDKCIRSDYANYLWNRSGFNK